MKHTDDERFYTALGELTRRAMLAAVLEVFEREHVLATIESLPR